MRPVCTKNVCAALYVYIYIYAPQTKARVCIQRPQVCTKNVCAALLQSRRSIHRLGLSTYDDDAVLHPQLHWHAASGAQLLNSCIRSAQVLHTLWWPHGAARPVARWVFGRAKHTMHVVAPPRLDSGMVLRPVMSPTSASVSTGGAGSVSASAALAAAAGATACVLEGALRRPALIPRPHHARHPRHARRARRGLLSTAWHGRNYFFSTAHSAGSSRIRL